MVELKEITLVSFGGFEKRFLSQIAKEVGTILQTRVNIKEEHLDLSEYFDPTRRQYNGDFILKKMDSMFHGTSKVIGIFAVDLFIPILTFIYGQAMLNGKSGVVSIYRLDNQRYGLKKDSELLNERLVKEIIHELGHTLGLIHCHTPNCVMRSSTYVEDIDQKNARFCHECLSQLEHSFSSLN